LSSHSLSLSISRALPAFIIVSSLPSSCLHKAEDSSAAVNSEEWEASSSSSSSPSITTSNNDVTNVLIAFEGAPRLAICSIGSNSNSNSAADGDGSSLDATSIIDLSPALTAAAHGATMSTERDIIVAVCPASSTVACVLGGGYAVATFDIAGELFVASG
jgi:hypothetical protein